MDRMVKECRFPLAGLALLLGIASPMAGAAEEPADAAGSDTGRPLPIEEIEITGQRSMRSMRFQLELVEEEMFALYNSLNHNDSYDVECVTGVRDQSRIRIRRCEPRFMQRARAQDARNLARDRTPPRSDRELESDFARQLVLMEKERDELAEQYPQLAEIMRRYEEQKEALRERQCERGFLARLLGPCARE